MRSRAPVASNTALPIAAGITTAVGSPDSVHRQLAAILEQTRADELIVAGAIHDHAARLHSYALLSKLAPDL